MVSKIWGSQSGQRVHRIAFLWTVFAGVATSFALAPIKTLSAQTITAQSTSLSSSIQLGNQARMPILLDRVVAVVNNDVIVESELLRRLDQVRRNLARAGQPMPPDRVLRDQVLDRMATDLALLQRALGVGLRVDDQSLDRAIARVNQNKNLNSLC